MKTLLTLALLVLTSPAFAQQNGSNADWRYTSDPGFQARETARREAQQAWVARINQQDGSDANFRYRPVAPVVTVPTLAPTFERR